MWVRSLDQEDPLEKGMETHSSILAWRTPWSLEGYSPQLHTESDTTEGTEHAHTHTHTHTSFYLNHKCKLYYQKSFFKIFYLEICKTMQQMCTFHSFHLLWLYYERQFWEMEFFPVRSGKIQLPFVSICHLVSLAGSLIKHTLLHLALKKTNKQELIWRKVCNYLLDEEPTNSSLLDGVR